MSESRPPSEFVALWTANARRVYAYIFSLAPNATDADDLLQETSLVLLQKFHEVGPIDNFSAWACKVAHYKVLEFYKRRQPAELVDERFLETIGQDVRSKIDGLDRRMEMLGECLAQLAEKDRRLIKLRYQGQSSVETTARKVGRTTSAVYKALARVREALLECISRKLAEGDA